MSTPVKFVKGNVTGGDYSRVGVGNIEFDSNGKQILLDGVPYGKTQITQLTSNSETIAVNDTYDQALSKLNNNKQNVLTPGPGITIQNNTIKVDPLIVTIEEDEESEDGSTFIPNVTYNEALTAYKSGREVRLQFYADELIFLSVNIHPFFQEFVMVGVATYFDYDSPSILIVGWSSSDNKVKLLEFSPEMKMKLSATAPSSYSTGSVYFNTTANKALVYNGTEWVDMLGNPVNTNYVGIVE